MNLKKVKNKYYDFYVLNERKQTYLVTITEILSKI